MDFATREAPGTLLLGVSFVSSGRGERSEGKVADLSRGFWYFCPGLLAGTSGRESRIDSKSAESFSSVSAVMTSGSVVHSWSGTCGSVEPTVVLLVVLLRSIVDS